MIAIGVAERSADACFGAHSGLKSDITALPKSAAINGHHAPVARAELYGYRSVAKGWIMSDLTWIKTFSTSDAKVLKSVAGLELTSLPF